MGVGWRFGVCIFAFLATFHKKGSDSDLFAFVIPENGEGGADQDYAEDEITDGAAILLISSGGGPVSTSLGLGGGTQELAIA